MATTFKGYESTGITTSTVVYTAPALTTSTAIGMTVANTSASTATVSVMKNLAYLVKDAPVPVGGALVVIGGDQKTVLETGSTLTVVSSGTVDVVLSVMEQA